MVSLEAQACGTPVVVSDSDGLRETVRHGESGFIVKGDLVRGLVDVLRRLLKESDLRNRLSESALTFSGQFQWERCIGELQGFLEEVAEKERFW